MEDESELVEISINHLGVDYTCIVNITEANVLLNDPVAASNFVEHNILSTETPSSSQINLETSKGTSSLGLSQDSRSHGINLDDILEAGSSKEESHLNIWTSKKPNKRDHQATLIFLKLREKYSQKFDGQKCSKSTLWKEISIEMQRLDYNLGGSAKEQVEKLRQKFANLQRSYLDYIKHTKTTGEGKKKPPPYFEEMHTILGNKDKIDPKYLQDSLEMDESDNASENSKENFSNENGIEESELGKIKNRFKTLKSVRPRSASSQLLEIIKLQHQENREDRTKQLETIENLMKTQNQQRERFLNILEKSFFSNPKKNGVIVQIVT